MSANENPAADQPAGDGAARVDHGGSVASIAAPAAPAGIAADGSDTAPTASPGRPSLEEFRRKAAQEELEWPLLKELALMNDMVDDDGYPTQAALELISSWHHSDPGLLEFVKSLWHLRNWGWSEVKACDLPASSPEFKNMFPNQTGLVYFISTGGWSGNESLIAAMQKNWIFWSLQWCQSRRGGHYVFCDRSSI